MESAMNPFTRWIDESGIRAVDVARILGVHPAEIIRYCREGYYPTKRVAIRMINLTGGSVTPTSFLMEAVEAAQVVKSREFVEARAAMKAASRHRKHLEMINAKKAYKKRPRGRIGSHRA